VVDKKEVGRRIKKIRLEMGYTLEEFGKLYKASKGVVNNWEKGRNLPNKQRLSDIAFYGQMSVDELLNGKRETTIDPMDLFRGDNDIRKYLIVDVDDAHIDFLKGVGISYQTIENVLKFADIYVNMSELPEELTIMKNV
jgi:transcriptional regulator with XRE-family HTH domain